MQLRLEFQYTFEDLQAAQEAHGKQARGGGRWLRGIAGWLLFIGLAVCLFIIQRSESRPGVRSGARRSPAVSIFEMYGGYTSVALAVGAFVLLFVFFFLRAQREARKRFDREPLLHQLQTVDITDSGLTHGGQTSSTFYRWDAFRKHVETPAFFLLYITDATYELLPKRAFPSQVEIDAFREFVTRVVSPPQHAFPVLPPKA